MNILRDFFTKPSAVICIILCLIFAGILQFLQIPVALYPATSKPKLNIWVGPATMSPAEFRDVYGKSIERSIKNANDVTKVEGRYSTGRVHYTVEFDWGVTSDEAMQTARTALSSYESQFPKSWGRASYWFNGGNSNQIMMSLNSEQRSVRELSEFAESTLQPVLDGIPGIEYSFVTAIDQYDILLKFDPAKLAHYKMDLDDVIRTVLLHTEHRGLGSVKVNERDLQVVVSQPVKDIQSLKNIVIRNLEGFTLKLAEVAEVSKTEPEHERHFRANGQESLLIGGSPKPDVNIKEFADTFDKLVREQARAFDPEIKVLSLLNPATFIEEAIENVFLAVLTGVIAATVIVFLFLVDIGVTLVVASSIPLSLIGGFILMRILGIELNLVSLGAMALACGMVVDGAIVVQENIARHIDEKLGEPTSLLDLVLAAVQEVKLPVIASLLTTVIVFAPLPFTSPITAALLGDLGIVVLCTLAVSIFITLAITPALYLMLAARLKRRPLAIAARFNRFQDGIVRKYVRSLTYLVDHKKAALIFSGLVIFVFGISIWVLYAKVEREIMGRPFTDKVFLNAYFRDSNIEPDIVKKLLQEDEQKVLTLLKKDAGHIISQVTKRDYWILINLQDKNRINEVKKILEEAFPNTAEMGYYVYDWTPTSLEIPNPPHIDLAVNTLDRNESFRILDEVSSTVGGLDFVGRSDAKPSPYKVEILKVNFKDFILSTLPIEKQVAIKEKVLNKIKAYSTSKVVDTIDFSGKQRNLRVEVAAGNESQGSSLQDAPIQINNALIPLKTYANLEITSDWPMIFVRDGREVFNYKAWPKESSDISRDEFLKQVKEKISANDAIAPEAITYFNSYGEINDNLRSLLYALSISIILVLLLLTLQFGRFTDSFIILLAVPLGLIGVASSLWIFSSKLNINSMLGIILLSGTAVNNSIIFLDFYNRIFKESSSARAAILETARLRFRPIIITTLTTIVGMLPIAIALGSGNELMQPLGIAVSGGLGISTLLTLYVIPLVILAKDKGRKHALSPVS